MILVDSSAWIEFYRAGGEPLVSEAVASAISEDLAAVNGLVQVEILPYVRTPAEYRKVASDFSAMHWLELSQAVFDLATDLGRKLRRNGITVPATDLTIAACAVAHETALLHFDHHYDLIAAHTPLRIAPVEQSES